jgi:subtilisin family serine protease
VDSKNRLYSSATQGNFISLAAPGVEIISTSPGGKLLVSSGTSLATAFVSGTAALALQQQSRLSPRALQTLLERTAQDLGPPGKDPQFGNGLVNACRAVAELKHDSKLCR